MDGGIILKQPNREVIRQIQSRLRDALSAILFEGWLQLLCGGDEKDLGRMVRRYWEQADVQVQKNSPELFTMLQKQVEVYDTREVIFAVGSISDLRQMRFCRGMGGRIQSVCCASAELLASRKENDPPFTAIASERLPECVPVVVPPGAQSQTVKAALSAAGVGASRQLSEDEFPLIPFTDMEGCYFDSAILDFGEDACFVDGGALDLYSSHRFARKTRGCYRAIHAYEPDPDNFQECLQNSQLFDERLHLRQLALWDQQKRLPFKARGECSCCHPQGSGTVRAETLDDLLEDTSPTHIKLHLEGAEQAALRGARQTIRRCHPQLMIALGHRVDDILQIPQIILEADASYHFYLRHYSNTITETVLYAL